MSAFIVGKEHLDYLLTAGMTCGHGVLRWVAPAPVPEGAHQRGEPWGPESAEFLARQGRSLTRETADKVGCMLWAENRRSVDHRYDENEIEPECYSYAPARVAVEPVQVLKAIACFEYQACEHPEWHGSEARAFCAALRHSVIQSLPGYEDALWEVDSASEARRRAEKAAADAAEKAAAESRARVSKLGGRNEVMRAIKAALERRSGKKWSVTGGRGTAWGWLTIDAPPARRTWHDVPNGKKDERGYDAHDEVSDPAKPFGHTGPEDRAELAKLLGKETVHFQGESVPSGSDYWAEYLDRAEGRKPGACGKIYWD